MSALPKFHETFMPILKTLKDGAVMQNNEFRMLVRDNFYAHLPKEILEQRTKHGDILILNRIGWGKAYLKMGNFIETPKRGQVRITKKGQERLAAGNFTLQDLKNDPDYQAHQDAKKDDKESENLILEQETPEDMIDSGIKIIERQVKTEILAKLKQIDPFYFEKVVLQLLQAMGYGEFIETKKSNDGGIDGVINKDQLGLEKIYMQAKRYQENKVRETEIRNFIGAMSGDTNKGIFVTTATFDEKAREKAKQAHHSIILVDGQKLAELMLAFGIGAKVKSTYQVKELDEDFFEA